MPSGSAKTGHEVKGDKLVQHEIAKQSWSQALHEMSARDVETILVEGERELAKIDREIKRLRKQSRVSFYLKLLLHIAYHDLTSFVFIIYIHSHIVT